MNSSTAVVVRRDHREYEMLMVVAGFLAGYTGNTRMAYQHDLRVFLAWCRNQQLHLLDVGRAHIELFRPHRTVGRFGESDGGSEAVDCGEFLPVLR